MNDQRAYRLLVSGGGTGGHTYPALTAARTLRARLAAAGRELDVLWVGVAGGLEERVAEAEGIAFEAVATGKIRRARNPLMLASPANLRDMGRVPLGVAQAQQIVSRWKPDVVLATGGYVAVPVGVAARMCRRPLVVHEQTVSLGLANKALARAATRFAVSAEPTIALLPGPARAGAVVTGNPVRPEILDGAPDRAVDALGLDGFDRALPTIYVTGGAQGARQINDLIVGNLAWLLARANIVHQCGPANLEVLRAETTGLPGELAGRYHLTDFVGPVGDVLALADVVISRSGAGTIAELTALGKPSVLVPLASAAGHEQERNAAHLSAAGAATTLPGGVTEAADLRAAITPLLDSPPNRAAMADAARKLGRPDAAERLVDVILDAAAERSPT